MKLLQLVLSVLFITALEIVYLNSAHALEPGSIAPDLTGASSLKLELDKYKGKVVYLDFWASWCAPCSRSLPWMEKISKDFPESEFKIIAVNVDTEKEKALKLIKEKNITLHVLFDPEGKLPELYQLASMPSSYLIGRDGKIISEYDEFSDEMEKNIESDIKTAINNGKS